MKVLKYGLELKTQQEILIPEGSKLLSIQNQDGSIVMWAKVNESNSDEVTDCVMVKRTFCIYGTGISFKDSNLMYVGTVGINGYVWHVFERKDNASTD